MLLTFHCSTICIDAQNRLKTCHTQSKKAFLHTKNNYIINNNFVHHMNLTNSHLLQSWINAIPPLVK